jgi:hypothetical protein
MDESEMRAVVHTEEDSNRTSTDLIMVTMPDPEARGYFGPRRNRPSIVSVTRAQGREHQLQQNKQSKQATMEEYRIGSHHSIQRVTFVSGNSWRSLWSTKNSVPVYHFTWARLSSLDSGHGQRK